MAPRTRDNSDERFARIEQLMEEYRLNHEDLVAYVQSVEGKARQRHLDSRKAISDARDTFNRSKSHH